MKTNRFVILTLFALTLFFQISCSKDSKGGVTTPHITYRLQNGVCYSSNGQQVNYTFCNHLNGGGNGSGYYMQGGYCFSYSNPQQPVSNSFCSGTGGTGSGYSIRGGYCFASTNPQQPVNMSYCQGTGTQPGTVPGTGTSGPCYGIYYYFDGYQLSSGECQGQNCSGYTLLNQQGQTVYCQ